MNDKQSPTNRPAWVVQASALLDDSARDLDAATLSRLNRARQVALESRRPRTAHPWLLGTGLASACALLLTVAVWQPRRHAETGSPTITSNVTAVNSETDTDETSPEFYQDLEFYAWLDAQNQGNGR